MQIPDGLKSRIAKQSAAALAASFTIAVAFICGHEGESLKSYEDVVGVWTICNGVTTGVKPGQTKTKAECDEFTQSTVGRFMAGVSGRLRVPVAPETLAAHTSFAYNIGLAGYDLSATLRLTNAGRIADGCRAMISWHTAGGKDCRVRENNCYGVITRRQDEINLCLEGLKNEQ